MTRTESSKDNVTETLSLLKQELDNTLKLKLKRIKKKRLQLARKSLKNFSCLEDTSLDCNHLQQWGICPATQFTFQSKLQHFFLQLITPYLTFR